MKVCFETFGCRLNKAEALQMEADYLARGWELTVEHHDADLFVVRGCSVTAHAQHDCERLINHLRTKYPDTPIRILGCLENRSEDAEPATDGGAALPVRTARAYLKVQDGCNGPCTFCIVPRFRGKSVSTPFDDVLSKARQFIESGYREIVVTGCNLSLYASEGKRLPELIAALAGLTPEDGEPGSCRIRLGSLEPGDCAMDTLYAMSEHRNACRFLHIPFQSGSDRILLAMKRPYRAKDVEALVDKARKLMRHPGIGCDVMAGFPGETEKDHKATLKLLQHLKFNNAHVFPYSNRPGTPAAAFEDQLPRDIRSERAHELLKVIQSARDEFARSFVGRTVDLLVEGDGRAVGWTNEYLRCEATGPSTRKSRIRVAVTGSHNDRLRGLVL